MIYMFYILMSSILIFLVSVSFIICLSIFLFCIPSHLSVSQVCVCVCVCARMGPILIQALSVGPPLILIKEQMLYPVPSAIPFCMRVCMCVCLSCFDPACPCHVPVLSYIVPRIGSVICMETELVGRTEGVRTSAQPVPQIG